RLPVSPSLMQVRLPRWPTQAAGALACLAALLFLLRKPTASLPTGVPALIALLTLSLSGLALSFLRGDPAPRWGAMRLDALAWAAALVLGLLALGLRRRPAPNR
ncbi:MAG: hypothetical protein MUO23_02970, partial [Anaerolineales bacterium]|nr:hypothetical protein [Anaerolineales bacterium]